MEKKERCMCLSQIATPKQAGLQNIFLASYIYR